MKKNIKQLAFEWSLDMFFIKFKPEQSDKKQILFFIYSNFFMDLTLSMNKHFMSTNGIILVGGGKKYMFR